VDVNSLPMTCILNIALVPLAFTMTLVLGNLARSAFPGFGLLSAKFFFCQRFFFDGDSANFNYNRGIVSAGNFMNLKYRIETRFLCGFQYFFSLFFLHVGNIFVMEVKLV